MGARGDRYDEDTRRVFAEGPRPRTGVDSGGRAYGGESATDKAYGRDGASTRGAVWSVSLVLLRAASVMLGRAGLL